MSLRNCLLNLQTKRLFFTPPRQKDASDAYSHKREIESTIFTGGITQKSWPDFKKEYLYNCINQEIKWKDIYSVILKDTDKYIGYCGFQYCNTLEGIEILYGYSSKYWGKGYAFEAAQALLSYGFMELGFENILAAVNPKNPASEAILHKIGMKFIGNIEWPDQGVVKKYGLSHEQFLIDI